MAFITTDDVKLYIGTDAPRDDALITQFITAAQRFIEDQTRRKLTPVTATRYYSQNDGRLQGQTLLLDEDLLTLTSLTNGNGTTISNSNAVLEPRNFGPPYSTIRLNLNSATSVWQFNLDGEIAVTGTWGYTDDPTFAAAHSSLKQWAIQLCAWMYRRRSSTNSDSDRPIVTGDGVTIMPNAVPKDIMQGIAAHRRLPR